jgi:Flp pilus assembly protein TadG
VPAPTAPHPGRRRRQGTRLRTRPHSDRGAAAVEFALVAPLLVFLLLGVVELSKVMLVQSSLSAAAREGARAVTLGGAPGAAPAVVQHAATSVALGTSQITVQGSCPAGTTSTSTVTVTVRYSQPVLYGVLGGAGVDLTGKAAMRCGG